MKKGMVLAILIASFILLLTGVALARYGVHEGKTPPNVGFAPATDACAGCHRGHTGVAMNLLVQADNPLTTEGLVYDFCITCHSSAATGANSDVEAGKWLARAGTASAESTVGGDLNSGGFITYQGVAVTSRHDADDSSRTAWGGGTTGPGEVINTTTGFTCTDCHDAHGLETYRNLKHTDVGGIADNDPGIVETNEVNFGGPIPSDPTWTDLTGYKPTYTEENPTRHYKERDWTISAGYVGISAFCAACHDQYLVKKSSYNAFGGGAAEMYRHSVSGMDVDQDGNPDNVPLSKYTGPQTLTSNLPLDKATRATAQTEGANQVMCLTCHRAHGTKAVMSGKAIIGARGVIPDSTFLLRLDNRGVCQNCHQK